MKTSRVCRLFLFLICSAFFVFPLTLMGREERSGGHAAHDTGRRGRAAYPAYGGRGNWQGSWNRGWTWNRGNAGWRMDYSNRGNWYGGYGTWGSNPDYYYYYYYPFSVYYYYPYSSAPNYYYSVPNYDFYNIEGGP